MLVSRPKIRQPSRFSPMNIPRSRTRQTSPPPVQALDYQTHSQSPVLLLPARQGTPPEDRLGLAWPSQERIQSQEFSESASFTDLSGHETATYHARALVTISSSGETTMHIQSSYFSLRSPTGRGGMRIHHSPGSGGSRSFSTPSRSGNQLTFPGSPRSRYRGAAPSSSNSTPHSTGTGSPKPGRSLLFEPASSNPTLRKRNLPALQFGGSGGNAKSVDRSANSPVSSYQQNEDSVDAGSDVKMRKTLAKEYKGVLEEDHPEEPVTRGRGMVYSCICTLISLLTLILIIVLVLCIFMPLGDPVLKIGMAPTDVLTSLRADVDRGVFGQHIANKLVVSVLQGLLLGEASKGPIVMSFHGSTGVGKTHMADILVRHFIESPDRQLCSHTFLTDFHIPLSDVLLANAYERLIQNWVNDQRVHHRSCKYLFLIFDELRADTPAELAIAMSNVLSEIKLRNEADGHAIIAIVMSDIGMHDINTHLSGVWESGTSRENVTANELVLLVKNAALYLDRHSNAQNTRFHEGQGKELNHGPFTAMLSSMDAVVPFLPLEQSHVKLCIVHDAIGKGLRLLEEDFSWVADQLTYFPTSSQVFSLSGCKKVSDKVDLLRNQYDAHQDNIS